VEAASVVARSWSGYNAIGATSESNCAFEIFGVSWAAGAVVAGDCCATAEDWPNDNMPTLHKTATRLRNNFFEDFEITCFAFIAFL
jgi:hypothetical protein